MLEKLRKICRLAAFVVIGAGLGAGASAQESLTADTLREKGVVRIGVLVDYPPFGFMNEKNEPDGYDIDVAKAIAAKMGVEVEIVPTTGPNRIPYLQTGQVDMLIAALGITPERSEQVLFSQPYSAAQGVFYARRKFEISSFADLAGVIVGVPRASPQDVQITKEAPEGTTIRRFDEVAAVYQAIVAGQIDGAAVNQLIALELDKQVGDEFESKFVLTRRVQGAAMRKNSPDLVASVDGHIDEILESGELNEIHLKWLNSELPELTNQ